MGFFASAARSDKGTNPGSNTSVASAGVSVSVGDLVVCNVTQESVSTTISTVSDGTSNLTLRSMNVGSGVNVFQTFAWHVSPNSGTLTYTATWGSAVTNPRIVIWVFTPTATPSFDTAIETAGVASTSLATGNITTTGTDELVLMGLHNENTITGGTTNINGLAVTANDGYFTGAIDLSYRAFASTFTGEGTATQASSGRWVASLIAFKIAGAGSSVKRTMLMGIG